MVFLVILLSPHHHLYIYIFRYGTLKVTATNTKFSLTQNIHNQQETGGHDEGGGIVVKCNVVKQFLAPRCGQPRRPLPLTPQASNGEATDKRSFCRCWRRAQAKEGEACMGRNGDRLFEVFVRGRGM